MPALESRVEAVWFVKQTAKGTPAANTATGMRKGRKVGGDVNVNRDDGSETYSDGQRFPDATDYVNSVVGDGNPVFQAQCALSAYLAYLQLGQETVTGSADPWTHTANPAAAGFWSTWWKSIGASVGPLNQQFSDARITSLRYEGSSANKVVKVTPTFSSVTAGLIPTALPTAVVSTEQPMLYTEGIGRFSIDGTVYSGHSSFAVVINDTITPWYGDDVLPYDVIFGTASVVLEGITILVDALGLQRYNTQIYGSATPSTGTAPVKAIPALGAYIVDLQRGANRQLKLSVPGVKWSPDLSVPGNPEGGPVELPLAGEARKSGASNMIDVITKIGEAAFV